MAHDMALRRAKKFRIWSATINPVLPVRFV